MLSLTDQYTIIVLPNNEEYKIEICLDDSIGVITSIISERLNRDINDIYLFYRTIDLIPNEYTELPNAEVIKTNIVSGVEEKTIIEVPIGYNKISEEYTNWIANPYKFSREIPYAKIPTINNNKCLVSGGYDAIDKTIYVCIKEDSIREYFYNKNLSRYIKINNREKELLNSWIEEFQEKNITKLNTEIKIKSIKIELYKGYFNDQKFDIHSLFKSIHSSPTFPVIKYTPAQINKMLRLYLSSQGETLYWDKQKIQRISKELTINKSIGITFDCMNIDLSTCEIKEENGHFVMNLHFSEAITEQKVNEYISLFILKLKQNNIDTPLFNGIDKTKILDMELHCFVYGDLVKLDLSKISYNSSFSYIINDKVKNKLTGNMFRVPEFNIIDVLRPHINEAIKNETPKSVVVKFIEKKFNLSAVDSSDYYDSIITEGDIKLNFRVKINDGFKTTLEKKVSNNANYLVGIYTGVNYYPYINILKTYTELIAFTSYSSNTIQKINQFVFAPIEYKEDEELESNFDYNDIYDLGDETEAEEEEEEEDGGDIKQGGNKLVDVEGFSIVNYMQNRIERYDKNLILKKSKNKFKSYSSTCQSADGRQPIALSNEELIAIQKYNPDYLNPDKYVSYKSNESIPTVNYICPRYWDLSNNLPLTEEDIINNNLQNNIISHNMKEATKDKYILEVSDKEGKIPSFQLDKHPDGFCLPCCFLKKTKNVLGKMDKCNISKESKESKELKEPEIVQAVRKRKTRISPLAISDKKILPATYISVLPPIIHKLIYPNIDNTEKILIAGSQQLMRRGVYIPEYSKQTFLCCIADALWDTKIENVPEVERLKSLFNDITLDEFLTLNNGTLIDIFNNKNISADYDNSEYNSKIYNQLKTNGNSLPKLNSFFSMVAQARKNFLTFIHSSNSVIDYKFIWSYVCSLFPEGGINLIIISINVNDNITVICPTDNSTFDKSKDCLFLIEQNGDYSPIYNIKCKNGVQCSKENAIMGKLFKASNKTLSVILNYVIHPSLNKCMFKTDYSMLSLNKLLKIIDVNNQIIQTYNILTNSVNGLLIETPNNSFFWMPCQPSPPITSIPIQMLSPELLSSIKLLNYNELVKIAEHFYKKTKGIINFRPKKMIHLNKDIIGYTSEINIFIPCFPTNKDDIKNEYMKDIDYSIDGKTQITVSTGYIFGKDEERIDFMKKVIQDNKNFESSKQIILDSIDSIKTEKIKEIMNNKYLKQSSKVLAIINIIEVSGLSNLHLALVADKILRNNLLNTNNVKSSLQIYNYSLDELEIIVLEVAFNAPNWTLNDNTKNTEDNVFIIDPINKRDNKDEDIDFSFQDISIPTIISRLFPSSVTQRIFNNNFGAIMSSFSYNSKKDIIQDLFIEYSKIDPPIIYSHFIEEDKNKFVKLLKNGIISLHDYIYSDNYEITLMDWILISNMKKINLIITVYDNKKINQYCIYSKNSNNNIWILLTGKKRISVLYLNGNNNFTHKINNGTIYSSLQEYLDEISKFNS